MKKEIEKAATLYIEAAKSKNLNEFWLNFPYSEFSTPAIANILREYLMEAHNQLAQDPSKVKFWVGLGGFVPALLSLENPLDFILTASDE